MSEEQTKAPAGVGGAPPETTDPVAVVGEFLVVDGCKVARVERGGVLAFSDKCRGRSERRGSDQVRVRASDLARVIESVEGEN